MNYRTIKRRRRQARRKLRLWRYKRRIESISNEMGAYFLDRFLQAAYTDSVIPKYGQLTLPYTEKSKTLSKVDYVRIVAQIINQVT